MIRKIGQQGKTTLTISLPSSWVKEYNLSKGDELEIKIEDNELRILTESDKEVESRYIDISKLDSISTKVVSELYKSGYEEIKIRFGSKLQRDDVKKVILERFIGCEIIRETESSLTVKKVSRIRHEEFDAMLKRTFQILITLGKDILDAFSNSDYAELESLKTTDREINKLTDFCRRALNKRDMTQYKKSKPLYYVVMQLERIGDCYKDLCTQIIKNQIERKESCIIPLKEINDYFKELYELFYRFDLDKSQAFFSKKDRIIKNLDEACIGTNPGEFKAIKIYYRMFNILIGLNGPVMLVYL